MPKILTPRLELTALIAAAKCPAPTLSELAGIPKTRIHDYLRGVGALSIDDLTRCKQVLSEQLTASVQTSERHDG
jgi:hypothetical protein